MREGWEIRKLGDVCDLYQPKTISTDMLVSDGKYLVYGANGIIGRYNEYNHEQPEVLMTCRGATCGSINISKRFSWINGNAMVVHPKQNNLGQSFLKYLLQSIDLSCVITGAAQPQITRQSLKPVKVVVPPIPEQEKIVAELDCLTSIIEKKKQQLEELDKLAQSIFYDMFGDPITNEKGWKTTALKAICDRLYAGGDVPKGRLSKTKTDTYSVPILSNGKGDSAIYGYTDIPRETSPAITISGRGTIGYSRIQIEPFFPIIRLIVAIPSPHINIVFLHTHISLMPFESTGGAIPQLTVPMVKNRSIICPPLDLQNEFAKKIDAIEKQKELVKMSIAETEMLFNSRMDFWFN